jgi:alkyl hydroperoxide reductase subunit AhpC
VIADPEMNLVRAAGVVHPGAGPGRTDVAAPTTVLLDRGGIVRWFYQPPRHIVRLTPDEVLTAIDKHLSH